MKIILYIAFELVLFCSCLFPNDKDNRNMIYGVTIDDISNIDDIVKSLKKLSKPPTTRIVFDQLRLPSYYLEAVNKIQNTGFIMGELLDSYGFADYTVQQYNDRVKKYLDAFGRKVDIWEIGNEINGEWLGNTDTVVRKITNAFRIVKDGGKVTAITLYYNNDCCEKPENEMYRWINSNIPVNMKDSLDYVFISYYEDDCNDFQPDWQSVFDSLHVIFPNSKLGIGECGTKFTERKKSYIERYYNLNISTPNFVGGYFWWYFKQDCVPYTKKLWRVLDSIFEKLK